jgi:LPS O-antigen subunit length determinant protein (WzzB/FepE family)
MTEQEIPLPSTPNQAQNLKHEPEDEVSLFDFLLVLVRKKVIIFFTASVFVVLSIFYAFSIEPTYRATIAFEPSGKHLTSFFPNFIFEILPNVSKDKKGILVINNDYLLNEFIAGLQSYANQEKVFDAGKFNERFVVNNPETDMKKEIVGEIHRSIHVDNELGGKKLRGRSNVAIFEMKGVKPEVASDFLNALVDLAKSKVEFDVKELIQHEAKAYIYVYSEELNYELSIKRQENKDKIRTFTDNLEIAKNLGILDNNFDNFKPDGSFFYEQTKNINSVVTSSRERLKGKAGNTWPAWYLYGQLALEQELNMMGDRSVAVPYSRKLIELNSNIEYLSNIDLSKMNLEQTIISQPSVPPVHPINIKRTYFIAVGIAFGLFIGILMALLSCLMPQLKERLKLSPPEFM